MKPCTAESLPTEILSRLSSSKGRLIVAIAGPPGAGKSTISEYLRDAINKGKAGPAVVVPMDGFHLDNAILDERGLRSRKGSPPTFDCAGLVALLARLRNTSEDVVIPTFDRKLDLARAGASVVRIDHKLLLVEGNYLLLDQDPWARLAPFFDMTIYLKVPFVELERRLIQRWLDHGRTEEAARDWIRTNDFPNAEIVVSGSREADYVVSPM